MILTWGTRDHRHIPIQSMTTSHIHNTIRMIQDGRMSREGRTNHNGFTNAEWVIIFNAELKRRANNQ